MQDELIQAMKPSQVISKSFVNNEYYLYLHGEIGSPDNFLEHFALYRTASAHDIIFLYVNSNGGSLSTGMEYIRHMRECEAPIVCILGMEVASMASAIALEADDLVIDEMSTMLVHGFSYGAAGNEFSVFNQAAFNKKLNERWLRSHYSNFLDESQITDALRGVDILLDSEDIQERWNNLKESRNQGECQDPDCGECAGEDIPTLDDMISDAVDEGVQKALKEVLKKYDLVAKPEKPKRPAKTTKPNIDPVVVANVEAFNQIS